MDRSQVAPNRKVFQRKQGTTNFTNTALQTVPAAGGSDLKPRRNQPNIVKSESNTTSGTSPGSATGRNSGSQPTPDPSDLRKCYHCKQTGHIRDNCPALPKDTRVNQRYTHASDSDLMDECYDGYISPGENDSDSENELP